MADFAWGLQQRGHSLQVISSNASYLGPNSEGPSGEPVDRRLQLKGSFEGGVRQLQDPAARAAVDAKNRALLTHWLGQGTWDGILLGNLDLLGTELLGPLLASNWPYSITSASSRLLTHPSKCPQRAAATEYSLPVTPCVGV